MPQSLLIATPPQGTSAKRQRSADSREPHAQHAAVGHNGRNFTSSSQDRGQLRANIRMPPYLEKSKTEILATFQELEWKQRFRLFHAMEHPHSSPYKVDRSAVVIDRNRYGNVQPWDSSRVKLKTPINSSDYVNASPIVLTSQSPSTLSGAVSQPPMEVRYVATQGPKQDQESHFWHMVHQETTGATGVVIMLTQLIEENKEKCAQYFPLDLDNPTMSLMNEDTKPTSSAVNPIHDGEDPFLDSIYSSGTDDSEASTSTDSNTSTAPSKLDDVHSDTITLLSKEFDNATGCEVRKLQLIINNTPKTIIHYLFGRWPDFGKPEAADRKALIEMSRRSFVEAGDSPRFVHCSAGVGRTGTWIALDFLIREVEEDRLLNSVRSPSTSTNNVNMTLNDQLTPTETWGRSGPTKVNTPTQDEGFDKDEHDLIFETVNTLREQRMMMVVREVQLAFLYEAVKEAVLEKYRARPEGAVVRNGAELDLAPRQKKAPRISEEAAADESLSEAETEIIDVTAQADATSDNEDPYSAVSPAFVRQGVHRHS